MTYNGYDTDEFVVQRTAAYVDQVDNHITELTVRLAGLCTTPCNNARLPALAPSTAGGRAWAGWM